MRRKVEASMYCLRLISDAGRENIDADAWHDVLTRAVLYVSKGELGTSTI